MDDQALRERVEAQAAWAVEMRRRLHRVPERGFEESKTQRIIVDALREMGIAYTTERTWVVGVIEGALPGGTVALRADMDALPLEEPQGCAFRSAHPGMMHACGHDAHMAMVLGAARVLAGMREELRGTVKLLFQPAEETVGGAQPMVEAGVMNGVSRVYGIHVQPYLPVGTIETRAGTLNASTDAVTLRIRGRAGHGAYPETGADAIVCAAQVVSALQTLISRNLSPLLSAVLTFGTVSGGSASNILCDEVCLRGTLRTANADVRAMMKRRVVQVAQGVAAAMGCTAEVTIDTGYAALVNDEAEAARVMRVGARLLGEDHVVQKAAPSMGGEDFSFFCERAPGAFFHLGCTDPARLPAPPLHSRDFALDEGCLRVGMLMYAALVLDEA